MRRFNTSAVTHDNLVETDKSSISALALPINGGIVPNPISKVHPNAKIILGNAGMGSPIEHNPQLALYALDVVRSWSDVENFRLNFYMEILGRNNEHAKAAFLALDSESAKNQSIRAVAARTLSEDLLKVFTAVQRLSKTVQRTRNEICHWTWGYSPQIDDGFLLVDPKAQAPEGDLRKNLIYVYKKQDFVNAIQASERLAGYFATFRFIVMGHLANRNGELESELRNTKELSDLIR